MEHEAEDQSIVKSIRQLTDEEHRLYSLTRTVRDWQRLMSN